MNKTLTILDVDLDVEFDIVGCYRPATRLDPAEYAEVEITAVSLDGTDITELLADWVIDKLRDSIDPVEIAYDMAINDAADRAEYENERIREREFA